VLNLVSILDPGTEVFFDNYFASPALLLELKNRGLPAACTLRSNRTEKCPLKTEKELKKEGRGAMDHKLSEDGDILIVKWFDNKDVLVAVTSCSPFTGSRPRPGSGTGEFCTTSLTSVWSMPTFCTRRRRKCLFATSSWMSPSP